MNTNKSDAINDLATALSKAQAQIKGAHRESDHPHFKHKYADLESVWNAIREPLTSNGLSVTQAINFYSPPAPDVQMILLETTLMHNSGQWIKSVMPVLSKDDSPQALGSGLSYARRYSLAALVGVYQTDDDAHAAQTPRHIGGDNFPPPKNHAPGMNKNIMPFGKTKGKRFDEVNPSEVVGALSWAKKNDKFKEFQLEAEEYLKTAAPPKTDDTERIPF